MIMFGITAALALGAVYLGGAWLIPAAIAFAAAWAALIWEARRRG
jgi:hypothetical protein